jgi:hypothetical protein
MLVRTLHRLGEKDTEKLVHEHGNRLVCVRYRYDFDTRKKYKTVELIIEENDWHPRIQATDTDQPSVRIRIAYNERELQRAIKAYGGRWSMSERVWLVGPVAVEELGLEDRVVS